MKAKLERIIYDLCRKGLQEEAEEAEQRWEKGEVFDPHSRRISRHLKDEISHANQHIGGALPATSK